MSFCISLSLSISLHFPPFLFLAPFLSSYPLCRLPTSALSDAPITLPLLSTSPSCTLLDSLSSFSASFHFHSSCSISLPNSFPLSPIPDLFAPSFPPFLPPFFLFFLPRATSPLCLSPHFSSFLSPFSLSDLGLLFFSHCSISLVLPPLIDIPSLLVSPFLPSSTPSHLIFSAFRFLPFSLSRIPFSSLLPSPFYPFSSYSSFLFPLPLVLIHFSPLFSLLSTPLFISPLSSLLSSISTSLFPPLDPPISLLLSYSPPLSSSSLFPFLLPFPL